LVSQEGLSSMELVKRKALRPAVKRKFRIFFLNISNYEKL
jgi:hypothetical protein